MRRLVAALVAIVLVAGGCGAGGPDSAGPELTVDCATLDASAGETLEQSLTVPVGSQFQVTLCSNASTGFSWEDPTWDGDAGIELATEGIIEPADAMPGAPGAQAFGFTTSDQGTSIIAFVYSQPWDGGTKAVWSVDVTVTVE